MESKQLLPAKKIRRAARFSFDISRYIKEMIIRMTRCFFKKNCLNIINPFWSSVTFLYPLNTLPHFQGVQKYDTGLKWVNDYFRNSPSKQMNLLDNLCRTFLWKINNR